MKYRHHRGSLEDSMKTVVDFSTIEELRAHLDKVYSFTGKTVAEIKFKYVGMDERIGWNTYYVLQRFDGEEIFTVAGMTNGCFE